MKRLTPRTPPPFAFAPLPGRVNPSALEADGELGDGEALYSKVRHMAFASVYVCASVCVHMHVPFMFRVHSPE